MGYNVGEGEDNTDGGAVPSVQLPSNVFQNYGEAEEDDPYRDWQPNYPAPQPVQDEAGLDGIYHHRVARSPDAATEQLGPKRRLKRGLIN